MTTQNPWHARAEELADWALARLFVRRDRYGGYYAADGETKKCARPPGARPNAVTRGLLLRHFRATRPADVVGAYLLSAEPAVGRAVAVDIDAHDDRVDPDANARVGAELYAGLVALGFRPLLCRWGGSVHLYALFASDRPGAALHAFGRSLVGASPIETYPKQATTLKADGTQGYGNWLRCPGRHHTRDQWAEVYDGSTWLAGAPAVAHLLGLTGDEVDISGCAGESGPPAAPPPRASSHTRTATDSVDVLAEYSRSQTLDDVCELHCRAGHELVRRGRDRGDFRRAGKGKGGESFNVQVIGGVPVTFNFSTGAGDLPVQKGLTPAHLRALAEYGACDAAALTRLADALRLAAGLPPRRRLVASAGALTAPVGSPPVLCEQRVAELELALARAEERISRLEWALAQAELRIGGGRVVG